VNVILIVVVTTIPGGHVGPPLRLPFPLMGKGLGVEGYPSITAT